MKKPYPFKIISAENYNYFHILRVCYPSATKEYVYEFSSEYAVRKILQFVEVKNFRKAKLFLDKFNIRKY